MLRHKVSFQLLGATCEVTGLDLEDSWQSGPPQVSWLMTGVEGSTVGAVNKLVACDSSIKAFIDGPHFVWVKICQNDFDPKNSIVYIIGWLVLFSLYWSGHRNPILRQTQKSCCAFESCWVTTFTMQFTDMKWLLLDVPRCSTPDITRMIPLIRMLS